MYSVLYKKNKHTKFHGNRYNGFRDTAITNSRPPAKFVLGPLYYNWHQAGGLTLKLNLRNFPEVRGGKQQNSAAFRYNSAVPPWSPPRR